MSIWYEPQRSHQKPWLEDKSLDIGWLVTPTNCTEYFIFLHFPAGTRYHRTKYFDWLCIWVPGHRRTPGLLSRTQRFSLRSSRATFGPWLIDRSWSKSNCSSFLCRRIWDLLISVQAHLGRTMRLQQRECHLGSCVVHFCFSCQLRPRLYLRCFGSW